MKTINTLISDIYSLLSRDVPLSVEKAKEIGARVTDTLVRRLATKDERRGVSMSSFGSPCWRKLWYQENKPEAAEALAPHTKLTFLIGDLCEDLALGFAEAAGHKVEGRQSVMELAGIKGHRDAVIDGVTVDVKSSNSRSFDKFKYHDLETNDPFGYLDQLSLYTVAAKDDPTVAVKKEMAFLAVDKELGHIVLDRYPVRNRDYAADIKTLKELLVKAEPPNRPFAPERDKNGNEYLKLECRYCPFKEICWDDANNGNGLRKFIDSRGPRWFTKVVKEPAGKEV